MSFSYQGNCGPMEEIANKLSELRLQLAELQSDSTNGRTTAMNSNRSLPH